jgi:hypothetical protein
MVGEMLMVCREQLLMSIVMFAGTHLLTSGLVHPARETTTSSIVIRPSRKSQNQSAFRNGTRKCWTKPSLKESSLTTRYVFDNPDNGFHQSASVFMHGAFVVRLNET